MASTPLNTIKSWFETGDFPTQAQFWALFGSFWHKDETIPQDKVQGLEGTLDAKADAEAFNGHLTDTDNPHQTTLETATAAGNTTKQDIVLLAEKAIRLTNGNTGEIDTEDSQGAEIKFIDVLQVNTPHDADTSMSYNGKYLLRSLSGVEADIKGEIDLVNIVKEVPEDFFVSCVSNKIDGGALGYYGKYMMYETNTFRLLDLYALFPEGTFNGSEQLFNSNNVTRNGNDFFIEGTLGTVSEELTDRFVIALYDTKLVNNEWVIGRAAYIRYTGLLADFNGGFTSVHAIEYKDGFLYFITRPNNTSSGGGTTIATQIIKMNAYNLSDYEILNLPTTQYYTNLATTMHLYNDWLYIKFDKLTPQIIYDNGVSVPGTNAATICESHFVRVSTDLKTYEYLFSIGVGNVNIGGVDKTMFGNDWIIHNDEIIVPMVGTQNTTEYKSTISVNVYTLWGELKRYKKIQWRPELDNNRTTIHWMTMFKNKLFFANSSSSGSQIKGMIRIDAGHGYDNNSIEFEDFAPMQFATQWTNDHSVTRDGYILLNPEGSYGKLGKLNCFDFSDYTGIDPIPEFGENGYWSLGSINPELNKESHKSNLSQFKNDLKQLKISALNTAPASATATGTTGEIRITADYIYVCVAANTWVRSALATW